MNLRCALIVALKLFHNFDFHMVYVATQSGNSGGRPGFGRGAGGFGGAPSS